jgi:hypothetical protein
MPVASMRLYSKRSFKFATIREYNSSVESEATTTTGIVKNPLPLVC